MSVFSGWGGGQQGGSLCHPGLPDEAPGQAGPLRRVRPRDGRDPGRDDTASAALLWCYRRLPLTGAPTRHPQLTGWSRWRGSMVGGGQHRPVLPPRRGAGQPLRPAGAFCGLSPVPCPGMWGHPALTGPRGGGPDPALRNKETEMTVSSLLEKQPKKRTLRRCDPGRACGTWTRPPGRGGGTFTKSTCHKKRTQALQSSGSRAGPGRALRCPCSPRPRLSRSPVRTPGSTSPAPPALAGTSSPSAPWQLTAQKGWPTAPAGRAGVSGAPAPTRAPHPGPPQTRHHLQLLLGLLRDAAFG